MADLTPNHPADKVAARALCVSDEAEIAASEAYAQGVGERPFSQRMRAALTAALPHLESATEENLSRLRDTPAGRALMAEALGKVLAVHTPKDNGRVSPCCSCEQWIESSDDEACIEYPCPTVEAITTALEGGTQ